MANKEIRKDAEYYGKVNQNQNEISHHIHKIAIIKKTQ